MLRISIFVMIIQASRSGFIHSQSEIEECDCDKLIIENKLLRELVLSGRTSFTKDNSDSVPDLESGLQPDKRNFNTGTNADQRTVESTPTWSEKLILSTYTNFVTTPIISEIPIMFRNRLLITTITELETTTEILTSTLTSSILVGVEPTSLTISPTPSLSLTHSHTPSPNLTPLNSILREDTFVSSSTPSLPSLTVSPTPSLPLIQRPTTSSLSSSGSLSPAGEQKETLLLNLLPTLSLSTIEEEKSPPSTKSLNSFSSTGEEEIFSSISPTPTLLTHSPTTLSLASSISLSSEGDEEETLSSSLTLAEKKPSPSLTTLIALSVEDGQEEKQQNRLIKPTSTLFSSISPQVEDISDLSLELHGTEDESEELHDEDRTEIPFTVAEKAKNEKSTTTIIQRRSLNNRFRFGNSGFKIFRF